MELVNGTLCDEGVHDSIGARARLQPHPYVRHWARHRHRKMQTGIEPGQCVCQITPNVLGKWLDLPRHAFRMTITTYGLTYETLCPAALPATVPDDQANWKLNPPSLPSTSSISPHSHSPGATRDSSVDASTWASGTPPAVTSAFS